MYYYRGAAMYWVEKLSGYHIASLSSVEDCTMVYGDRRGIIDDMAVQDACAVYGLMYRG